MYRVAPHSTRAALPARLAALAGRRRRGAWSLGGQAPAHRLGSDTVTAQMPSAVCRACKAEDVRVSGQLPLEVRASVRI